MAEIKNVYSKEYFENYDIGERKVSYEASEDIKGFLYEVANHIVKSYNPKTVLDVGCAMGFLVEALREHHVEAYGIDISEYAIGKVREDIRTYCQRISALNELPENMPKKYDIAVCIEVAEHIDRENIDQFIKNLCSYADTILFSSTPDGYEEPTHVNVQKQDYWAKKFAEYGFYRDFKRDNKYISKQAISFIKKDLNKEDIIEGYEQALSQSDEKLVSIQNCNNNLRLQEKLNYQQELKEIHNLLDDVLKENIDLVNQINNIVRENEEIRQSFFWKITKPFRILMDAFKRFFNSNKATKMVYKGVSSIKHYGIKTTSRKIYYVVTRKHTSRLYLKKKMFTEAEKEQQRLTVFEKNIKFSILVPLFNTPEKFLRDMIESVINQTYSNWELCLADGSDQEHAYVGTVVKQYMKQDLRIRYEVLVENRGISGNTNSCIEMATGDYIALFDHDDILHPAALYENMKVITEQNADFIYTDEAVFHYTPQDAYFAHFKPDFAPDTLRANNYICHFSVFSRELLEQVGGFRDEYNGSQDFDIILRLTEKAQRIVHIPKILYYWRAHKNSVASDLSAKPYAITAAKKAINDHLKRIGLEGEAIDSSSLSTYKINYKLAEKPLISIIIPNRDDLVNLRKCMAYLLEKTNYINYEVIIIDYGSEKSSTLDYLRIISNNSKVKYYTIESVNFAAIYNFGAEHANGKYLVFLDSDVQVITTQWIEEMLMYAQRNDVGAVGAKLYYSDNTVQHAGVGLGFKNIIGYYHRSLPRNYPGYMARLSYAQNVSAVISACMMVSKTLYQKMQGMDETFGELLYDIDFCMRLRQKGYLIVFTPYAELYHYEPKTKNVEYVRSKKHHLPKEIEIFQDRWKKELELGDAYYNPNFSKDRVDFTIG